MLWLNISSECNDQNNLRLMGWIWQRASWFIAPFHQLVVVSGGMLSNMLKVWLRKERWSTRLPVRQIVVLIIWCSFIVEKALYGFASGY